MIDLRCSVSPSSSVVRKTKSWFVGRRKNKNTPVRLTTILTVLSISWLKRAATSSEFSNSPCRRLVVSSLRSSTCIARRIRKISRFSQSLYNLSSATITDKNTIARSIISSWSCTPSLKRKLMIGCFNSKAHWHLHRKQRLAQPVLKNCSTGPPLTWMQWSTRSPQSNVSPAIYLVDE